MRWCVSTDDRPLDLDLLQALDALAVLDEMPRRFGCERLLADTRVGVVREGHPLADAAPDPDRFAAQRHALVTERGDGTGAVDAAQARMGSARRIVVTLPVVSLAPMLLVERDAIAAVAREAARRLARTAQIRRVEVPVDIPAWHLSLVRPARRTDDGGEGGAPSTAAHPPYLSARPTGGVEARRAGRWA